LGEAMGMIECAGDESSVAVAIANKSIEPLMEIESKSSLTEYQDKKDAANSWGSDFQRVWSEIKESDSNPSDALKALRTELDSLTSKVADLKLTVDENGKVKKRMESERRKLLMDLAAIQSQWDNVLPNRPQPPVEPIRPRPPETFYKPRDPKTGLEEIDRVRTDNDRQRFNNEMNTYRQRLTQYQDDARQFPARLKDWEQREADRKNKLKQDKVAKEVEIENKVKEMKDQAEAAAVDYEQHQEALKEFKANESRWFVTDRVVKQLVSSSSKDKSLFRPSNFRFFDFEHEQTRLEICLKN
jgi:chromosome segregation ATPase